MMPVEFDITGKAVLITGAGRGIGRGIAEVLAEAGADIALNALTPRYVEAAAGEIAKASGRRVVSVIADVTNSEGARAAVERAIATLGRVDVLVNALGDAIRKPLVGLPGQEEEGIGIADDDLRFIMDINLTEALLCTRAVGPHMLSRRSGKIINVAAWTAHQGGREMVLYTTAKTALAGFTRAQALEWAPYGIHVNAIAPGLFPDVVTSGEQGVRRTIERAEATVPLRRPGRLREAGFLALYLASSASDYMTGQTILLDGGLGL
jgi:NAD(P)-dependent dehydrogenase (short-subunit alcohol dehydrogenase family)